MSDLCQHSVGGMISDYTMPLRELFSVLLEVQGFPFLFLPVLFLALYALLLLGNLPFAHTSVIVSHMKSASIRMCSFCPDLSHLYK